MAFLMFKISKTVRPTDNVTMAVAH